MTVTPNTGQLWRWKPEGIIYFVLSPLRHYVADAYYFNAVCAQTGRKLEMQWNLDNKQYWELVC